MTPADPDQPGTNAHRPKQVTDARTLRALAHPSRLALWELLTVYGPMTATQAAEHVDDSPSNCSFHLRQLAKYGLVEEASEVAGAGRARPWRVTQVGITTRQDPPGAPTDAIVGPAGVDPAFEIADETLVDVVLQRTLARQRRWSRRKRTAEPAWRDIGRTAQTVWWVTAEEAAEVSSEIEALLFRFSERLADPATRPAGARPIEFVTMVHPFDDHPPDDHPSNVQASDDTATAEDES
jgi:hypothetical protein